MTAIDRYIRLEAVGLWREAPDQPPREVIVSFGKSTLILRDLADSPLGHWALAGLQVLGERDGATLYAMTADGAETLAIRDRDMVAAIAEIRAGLRPWPTSGPRRRRTRFLGPLFLLAALGTALAIAPGVLRQLAVAMMPPEQAQETGDRILLALMEEGGAICAAPDGQRVLDRIAASSATPPPRIRVLDLGGRHAAALPGGTVVVDRGAIVDGPDAGAVAGWIAAALGADPVDALMSAAGPISTLRYVFTGDLDAEAIARAAAAVRTGTLPAARPAEGVQPLSVADMVALLGICG